MREERRFSFRLGPGETNSLIVDAPSDRGCEIPLPCILSDPHATVECFADGQRVLLPPGPVSLISGLTVKFFEKLLLRVTAEQLTEPVDVYVQVYSYPLHQLRAIGVVPESHKAKEMNEGADST